MSFQEQLVAARARCEKLKKELEAHKRERRDTNLREESGAVPDIHRFRLDSRRHLRDHASKVYALHWSQDSRNLCSASQDGRLIVWNALTTYKIATIPLRSVWVMTCAYSPGGTLVACGGLDNHCTIFKIKGNARDTQVQKPSRELSHHTGYISCCRFCTDQYMLTSSGDMSCILWDLEDGKVLTKYAGPRGHCGDVMCVSVDKEATAFVSGSCDGSCKLWDIRSGECSRTFKNSPLDPNSLDINTIQYFPSYGAFGSGDDKGNCRLWDLRADGPLMEYSLMDDRGGVTSIAFSKSGRLLFAGYDEHPAVVWDVLKGDMLKNLDKHTDRASALATAPDGFALATGSWDYSIRIWA